MEITPSFQGGCVINASLREASYIARAIDLMTCSGCEESGIQKCDCLCNRMTKGAEEIRKSRYKAPEKWAIDADGDWFCPECMEYLGMGIDPNENRYKYCPFCGKEKRDFYGPDDE